jgi:uncharacterized protein YdhG (YjbR/CyaY superfamily)
MRFRRSLFCDERRSSSEERGGISGGGAGTSLSTLKHVRAVIRSVVPAEATEVISYGIPIFKYKRMLVGYAAFKNHCSLFPTGSGVIKKFEKELKGFATSKGTIQFPSDKPLPDVLVKKIVKTRVAENREWD